MSIVSVILGRILHLGPGYMARLAHSAKNLAI